MTLYIRFHQVPHYLKEEYRVSGAILSNAFDFGRISECAHVQSASYQIHSDGWAGRNRSKNQWKLVKKEREQKLCSLYSSY